MIITPDREYPSILTGLKKSYDSDSGFRLDLINLNAASNWFENEIRDGTETVIARHEQLDITSATQLDKDTILVCYDSKLIIINGQFTFKCNCFSHANCFACSPLSRLRESD